MCYSFWEKVYSVLIGVVWYRVHVLRLLLYSVWLLVCYVCMVYVKMSLDGEFWTNLKVYLFALLCWRVCISGGLYIYIYV